MGRAEAILIERARGGDSSAFSALVEERWTALVRLARSVTGEADAEDAVQDALVKAWRKLGSLRDPEALRAWLARIVVHVCLRRTRRRRFTLALDEVPEPVHESGTEAALDVAKLLGLLAPRQRAVLHLTVVEGMSDSEIAAVMDLSPAGVRSHRRRGRERLSQILEGGPR